MVEGPGDTDRETIAPTTLRPYSEADEEEEPPATATPGAPAKPGGEVAGKPTTYRVRLDVGWQRLRGEEPSHPPLIALVVAPDDARRLHHIFRTGTRILVLTAD